MLLKNNQLNRWFWRWHIIAGLITLPIVILLSVTGVLYLFKDDYNNAVYEEMRFVEPQSQGSVRLDFQSQFQSVTNFTDQHVMQIFVPESEMHATGFRLHGHGHTKQMVYVDPYTGAVKGQVDQQDTLMYKIRKLHGELLLHKWGTLTVELVSSWFIVLIITGIYIWWPLKAFSLSGLFTIRIKSGSKKFWRDMHAVMGFWLSLFMLVILSGGMPWTDVFGSQLKWVQAQTDTGYPEHWRAPSSKLTSVVSGDKLPLNTVMEQVENLELTGKLVVAMPMSEEGVYKVSNRSFWLSDQQVIYLDQYSGQVVQSYTWQDVGILMDMRQVAMRLHQGEYGAISWWLVLIVSVLFIISTVAGLVSYLIRKPKGRWGLPKVPVGFQINKGVLSCILFLGVLFPMFGLSLIVITTVEWVMTKRVARMLMPSIKVKG